MSESKANLLARVAELEAELAVQLRIVDHLQVERDTLREKVARLESLLPTADD